MPQIQRVKVYKYKNIAAALAVVLLALVALSTNVGITASKKSSSKNNTSVTSEEKKKTAKKKDDSSKVRLTQNYQYDEYSNTVSLDSGALAIVDQDHPYNSEPSDTAILYDYMFDDDGTQIMYAGSTMISGDRKMLAAFNTMISDFYAETGIGDIMVWQLIPESGDSKYDEAALGTCVDLMIYDPAAGTYDPFAANDRYEWLAVNCYKYGFVFTKADRVRYITPVVADYLHKNEMTLDDFMSKVKKYSFEKPLYYTDEHSVENAIYFVKKSKKDTTNIPVPLREDNSPYDYEISGNNDDGYVMIVKLSHSSEVEDYYENDSAAESEAETVNG